MQQGSYSKKENLMLLSVQQLTISKPGFDIVSDLSFNLESSSSLGIVGESGSGKTLTGLSILGLLPPSLTIKQGKLLFSRNGDQTDICQQSDDKMRELRGKHISMIFQEPMTALNPARTCGSQLSEIIQRFYNYNRNEIEEYAEVLLREVMIPSPSEALKKYPHQMSGGQRQRIMIAMAIAAKPELLIADEPTTALDVTVQKEILRLLKQLQEKFNMGMLFISHDLGVVKQVSDNVLVMRQGRMIEYGSASEILRNPKNNYTKLLIACKPKLEGNPEILPTIENVTTNVDTFFSEKPSIDYKTELLKVENLSVIYHSGSMFDSTNKQFKALDNVSVEIFKNETIGLVGESGCGKTTLGRTIMRLIEQTNGNVFFEGQNISHIHGKGLKELKRKIQYIFQDPYSSLNPHMTILEAIAEPIVVHNILSSTKEINSRVTELLLQVGLSTDFLRRYPHQLSGGQRQRIVIARALSLEPELIICDESVAALDVSVQAQVLNLLNRLKKQHNLSLLFISHDLSVVKYMSDRVYVMRNGSIIEHGKSDELYNQPQSDYTRQLIEAIPEI